jgi:hypothetical protein
MTVNVATTGSYFCVRFPEHQVVAIDVNGNGLGVTVLLDHILGIRPDEVGSLR